MYFKNRERYFLSSIFNKNKIPVLDVLYNHQYNMEFLTLNNFKKKNKLLNDLHIQIQNVNRTLIQGIYVCESLLNEIDKRYLLTSKTTKIPYCFNTSVGF